MGKIIGLLFLVGGSLTLRYFIYESALSLYMGLPILMVATVLLTLESRNGLPYSPVDTY